MITRIWHGRTKKEDADSYRNYVIKTGVHDYQKVEGNIDVQLLQNEEDGVSNIWMVTRWQDVDSIKKFTGKDIATPKYYPEDEKYLLELESKVIHCKTYSFSNSRIKNYIRQFRQLYEGGSWNNECYLEKLKSVDAQMAFVQPIPGKHSVAEILWHCIYWKIILIKNIEGDFEFRKETENEQNFLPLKILQQKGWKNLISEFKRVHETLIALLREKNDEFLQEEYSAGRNFDYIIEGLIHHDIYHLGQIGMVISLLNLKQINKPTGFADLHNKMFII